MWPPTTTTASARFAVTQAFWAATVCAAGVALLVTLSQVTPGDRPSFPFRFGALLDAVAFAAVLVDVDLRQAGLAGLLAHWASSQFDCSRPRSCSGAILYSRLQ